MKRGIWVRYAAYVYGFGRCERMCDFIFAFTPIQKSRYIYRLLVIFVVQIFISTAKFHIKNLRSIICISLEARKNFGRFIKSFIFWPYKSVESLFIFWALSQNCEKRLLTFTCLSVRPSASVSLRPYAATRLPLDGYS